MSELHRPVQAGESVLRAHARRNARLEHEFDYVVPAVSTGVEKRRLALLGGRIGEQFFDCVEPSESGCSFEIELHAALGEKLRRLRTSIRQTAPYGIALSELK